MALLGADTLTGEEVQRVERVILADRFHWTLDYIDEMDPLERLELVTLLGAIDAAKAHKMRQAHEH